MIVLVAARSKNGVIGRDGHLPWNLPDELRHFKELTLGKTVVMGRTTFDSIVAQLGRPLPSRHNVVLTRDEFFEHLGVTVVHDPDEIIRGDKNIPDEIYVIGGASLYAEMLPLANKLHMTEVDAEIDGDTYFPDYDMSEWREVGRSHHGIDERHEFAFDMVEYERV